MEGKVLIEAQSGHVMLGTDQKPANLFIKDSRLNLTISESGGLFGLNHPERLELLQFNGSQNVFTLLNLLKIRSQARLGVGGVSTYSVQLAIEDVLFADPVDIKCEHWLLYVEDQAKIVHLTGLQESFVFSEHNKVTINWAFSPCDPIVLECPDAGLSVTLGQDMTRGGDLISGPVIALRYPARIEFETEIPLYEALERLNQIRFFFSLLMGRVLSIDEVSLCLGPTDNRHNAKVHGLRPIERTASPTNRLVKVDNSAILARMLNVWFARYDGLQDAIHLHMNGLEQRQIAMPLRFQTFVQAIEALHRKTTENSAEPVNVDSVLKLLRERGIASDIVDRVSSTLAHAHEPALRQRLKSYWKAFQVELAVLRPDVDAKMFVNRLVATRNHFAHRMNANDQVLDGRELWDAIETVKAISHMALVKEIGGDISGLGTSMLNSNFAEYIVDEAAPAFAVHTMANTA